MVEGGERMKSSKPEDRIPEPGMDHCDPSARIVRKSGKGRDFHACKERQGVALEPRPGDSGSREREEQEVEYPMAGFRRDVHPAWGLGRVRSRVDHSPKHAHYGEREHTHSQRLVDLPVEISGD